MPEIFSRKDAIQRGAIRYFTGKPCKNGHISERYTKKSTCVDCDSERHKAENLSDEDLACRNARHAKTKKAWRAANPERTKAKQAEYRSAECPVRRKERMRIWRTANLEKIEQYKKDNIERSRELERARNRRNPEARKIARDRHKKNNPEKYKAVIAAWVEANKEAILARRKEYRKQNLARYAAHAANRRSAKINATPAWADLEKIADMYQLAASQGLTVDHIVPLQSGLVCGLHWHGNMELISMKENIAKGNRHWPDMP